MGFGGRSLQHYNALNHNPLDFIEAEFIAPGIIELRRARRGMVCLCRGFFERAAVVEIGRDPGRAEAVVAELGSNAGRRGGGSSHTRSPAAPCGLSLPVPRSIVRTSAPLDRRAGWRH